MAWTKAKTIAVVGVVAVLAAGTTATLVRKHEHRRRATDLMPAAGVRRDGAAGHILQGHWKGTNTAHPGETCTLNISGDRIEYRGDDPNDWLRGTFVLNEEADPKELNVTILEPAGSFILCIYQANGNDISIAAAEHGSRQGPVAFVPGRQVDVLELQRD